MILQYFVTETATERKIPIEIDRATDADLAGTKSCWQTDWTSEFIGDPDLEKYAAKTEDGEIVADFDRSDIEADISNTMFDLNETDAQIAALRSGMPAASGNRARAPFTPGAASGSLLQGLDSSLANPPRKAYFQ